MHILLPCVLLEAVVYSEVWSKTWSFFIIKRLIMRTIQLSLGASNHHCDICYWVNKCQQLLINSNTLKLVQTLKAFNMSPIGTLRSFHLRSIILRKEEVIVASAFSLQLLWFVFRFTYYTLIITIGRTMRYLFGLKRFINKGIFVIDVMSCNWMVTFFLGAE